MPLRETPSTIYPSYRVARPKLVGGALSLDFVNTVEWRGAPERAERLTHYGELLIWAEAAGAIDRKTRPRLAAAAAARPEAAAAALQAARALRETLAELLSASTPGRSRSERPALLTRLNEWLGRAPERRRIAAAGEGHEWAAPGGGRDLAKPLWPVVWSAADLLVSGAAARVRSCTDRRCGWLFLDTSRTRRRRWCSMKGCGNRAKARRHYRRHRAA